MKVKLDDVKLFIAMSKSGLNSMEVSTAAGISRTTFSAIKNGRTCNPQTAYKIANALNIDVGELIKN